LYLVIYQSFSITSGGIKIGDNSHTVSLVEGTCNALIGAIRTENPLLTRSNTVAVGKNDATISYTHASVGIATTARVKKLKNGPYMDYEMKTLASSKETN
jgi:hypothetical protein